MASGGGTPCSGRSVSQGSRGPPDRPRSSGSRQQGLWRSPSCPAVTAGPPQAPRHLWPSAGKPALPANRPEWADVPGPKSAKPTPVDPGGKPRIHAVPGYRGYVPGVKPETIWGCSFKRINDMAYDIRPDPHIDPVQPDWNLAPDDKQGLRSFDKMKTWVEHQHQPAPDHPGRLVSHGAGIMGYCGHRQFRTSQGPDQAEVGSLERGQRLTRSVAMTHERECMPWDVHRAQMPGYAGHVRNRGSMNSPGLI